MLSCQGFQYIIAVHQTNDFYHASSPLNVFKFNAVQMLYFVVAVEGNIMYSYLILCFCSNLVDLFLYIHSSILSMHVMCQKMLTLSYCSTECCSQSQYYHLTKLNLALKLQVMSFEHYWHFLYALHSFWFKHLSSLCYKGHFYGFYISGSSNYYQWLSSLS